MSTALVIAFSSVLTLVQKATPGWFRFCKTNESKGKVITQFK